MDIDSECFPCIPMSTAIQLSQHHSASTLLTTTAGGTSLISSKSKSPLAAALNSNSAAKNVTLAALLNGTSGTSVKASHSPNSLGLPPTPPGSNAGSDCEVSLFPAGTPTTTASTTTGRPNKKQRAGGNNSILSPSSVSSSSSSSSTRASTPSPNALTKQTTCTTTSNAAAAVIRSNTATQAVSTLISVQPKNAASGTAVVLTEEEKRTLVAEGSYHLPPLDYATNVPCDLPHAINQVIRSRRDSR